MGWEKSEYLRWGLSLGDSYPGTDHCKTEKEGALLSLICSSFSVQAQLSGHSAVAGRDRWRRSWATYLIWMIMLQVSHQNCSAWITNYFSPTQCLFWGTQTMARIMRDGSNKWGLNSWCQGLAEKAETAKTMQSVGRDEGGPRRTVRLG